MVYVDSTLCIQWNLSNPDTNGAVEIGVVSEVSSFQRLKCVQEWYLGWDKRVLFRELSSVQECPHRKREREVPLYAVHMTPHRERERERERERFHCIDTVHYERVSRCNRSRLRCL